MTRGRAAEFLREAGQARRVTYLELFFDLAFILALMRLSQNLLPDLSLPAAARTLLLLAALWAVWVTTAWSATWYHTGDRVTREFLLGVMAGLLVMAASVPTAFGPHAVEFVAAYLAVHLGRGLAFAAMLRGHPRQRRSLRIVVSFLFTGVLWVAGAVVPSARVPLWAVAVSLDYIMTRLRWPTPGLGRSSWEELRVVGVHLAERYQQIFIIALGELILAAGTAYSNTRFGPAATVAFGLAFVNAALLAQVYFIPREGRLGTAIDASAEPGRLAMNTAFLHLALVAGVLASAVGDELVIAHPQGRPRTAVVIITVAGVAIFLAARNVTAYLIDRRPPWSGMIGLVVVIALTPALPRLPTPGVIAAADLTLAAIATDFHFRRRRRTGQVTDRRDQFR